MPRGLKVSGGDRLGKTIIFAANNRHAELIAERFDVNYPEYKSEFAQVMTYRKDYLQSLIDQSSDPNKHPHIVISVDLLDTGIDVPEVVNLVFFKLVRPRTSFRPGNGPVAGPGYQMAVPETPYRGAPLSSTTQRNESEPPLDQH